MSSSYLNKYIQALSLFCDYLRRSGRLSIGKLNIKSEENTKEIPPVLTEEEVRQLYQPCDEYPDNQSGKPDWFYPVMALRDKAMLTVYYGCGLRRTEGLSLEVDDILFEKKYCMFAKERTTKSGLFRLANRA